MKTYMKKTFFYILKSNWLIYFISGIFSIVLLIISFFAFFDFETINSFYQGEIPLYDEYIITNIGLTGINKQGYIFSFFFLVLILIVFYLLSGFSINKKEKNIVALLVIKGFKSPTIMYYLMHLIIFIFSQIISLLIYLFACIIINSIINTQMPFMCLNQSTLLIWLLNILIFAVLRFPFYYFPYQDEKIIKIIREFN